MVTAFLAPTNLSSSFLPPISQDSTVQDLATCKSQCHERASQSGRRRGESKGDMRWRGGGGWWKGGISFLQEGCEFVEELFAQRKCPSRSPGRRQLPDGAFFTPLLVSGHAGCLSWCRMDFGIHEV